MPSPKGLAAQSISVPEVYFQTTPVNFLMSKHKNPRVGQVEARYTISTRFFDDPKEGREHIKQLAIEIGCNAVLNLSFEKDTFSSGNYRYTVHAFTGDLALVTEKTPCNSKELEASSQQAVINTVVESASLFEEVKERESEARRKQLEPGCSAFIGFAVFGLFVMLFFVIVFGG